MFWLFAGLYLLVACRLFSLQVMQQKKFGDIAKAQQEGEIEIPALRGDIRDRNNIVLATSLSLYSIAMNPREVKDPEATALALSQVLGRPKAELDKILSSGATFAWAKRKVEDKVADQVRELALPGVFLLKEQTGQRFYPKGRLLGTLLGVFLISFLNNVLNYMNVSTFLQWVVQGLIIIAAVSFHGIGRRRS